MPGFIFPFPLAPPYQGIHLPRRTEASAQSKQSSPGPHGKPGSKHAFERYLVLQGVGAKSQR